MTLLMVLFYLFIGFVIGLAIGVMLMSLISTKSYDKGVKDSQKKLTL